MGLFFKNPMIPHPLRRKRGAESKRITETRRPIGFLSTQGLCGPRRSLAENVQRRLDVIATYSRLPIVGVSERDTAPFHEMILQVRPRRERGSPRSAQDQDQSFGCQGIVGPPGQDCAIRARNAPKELAKILRFIGECNGVGKGEVQQWTRADPIISPIDKTTLPNPRQAFTSRSPAKSFTPRRRMITRHGNLRCQRASGSFFAT